MTIRWPEQVLPPRQVAFDIAPRTLAAPANIYGVSQVVAQDAGIWRATFGDIHVRGRDPVVAFRGIATELEGRVGKILVPLCRSYQPLDADIDVSTIVSPVPHSDEAFFSDDSGYVSDAMYAYAADAPARATALTVTVVYGGTLMPGHHFSVGERLYRLKTVSYASATVANVTIRPPLREAITLNGTPLDFDDPVCRMRLASDTEMDLLLDMRRQGNPTVNFVEDL